MFAVTERQKNKIRAFNASKISVTALSNFFYEDAMMVIEELCPAPVDLQSIMQEYGETEWIRIPRTRGASYGSHAALHVIVLSLKWTEDKSLYCIVEIN